MKLWSMLVASVALVLALGGCNDKMKADLAKCQGDLTKAGTDLTAAKADSDAAKKSLADLQTKFGDLSKEREALLVRVTQAEAQVAQLTAPKEEPKKDEKKAPAGKKTPTGAKAPTAAPAAKGKLKNR
jgi:septal ring factor EnvC (AmiA/AmiB activator)